MQTKMSIRQAETKSILRICTILSVAFVTMILFCCLAFFIFFQIKQQYQTQLQEPLIIKNRISIIGGTFNRELLRARGGLTKEEDKAFKGDMNQAWKEFQAVRDALTELNRTYGLRDYKKFCDCMFELKNNMLKYINAKDHADSVKKLKKIKSLYEQALALSDGLSDDMRSRVSKNLQNYVIAFVTILVINIILFTVLLIFLIQYLKHQKRFSKLFQDQTNWLNHLLNSLDAAIISINGSGRVTHWSHATHTLFNISAAEAERKHYIDVLPFLADYQQVINKLTAQPVEQKLMKQQIRFQRRNYYLNLSFIPLSYQGQQFTVIEIVDVTEAEIREHHVQQAQRMETVRNMMTGMANEFNNVLGILRNSVSVMRHALDFDQEHFRQSYKETVNAIEDTTDRATVMVEQMISLVLNEQLKFDQLSLNTLIKHIGKLSRNSIESGIEVQVVPYAGKATVKADPKQLELVLLHMIDNSVKAIETDDSNVKEKMICLAIEELEEDSDFRQRFPEADKEHYWIIRVSDSGIGIEPEIADKIFDPFFSSEHSLHGSGLGLAAANEVIRKHGGFLDCYSVPGKGTDFYIYLPELVTDSEEIVIEEIEEKEKLLATGKGTILVVDDEIHLREMARNILKTLGYEVMLAGDGFEALELFKKSKDDIDVVFMDMLMPKMSGLDTFIKMKDVRKDIKVIMVSGYCGQDKIDASMKEGAVSFMSKPYMIQDLAGEIEKAMTMAD